MTDTRILPVPREMLPAMWPLVAPWLTKGLAAATTSSLPEIWERVAGGWETVWVLFRNNELQGAFVAGLRDDEDGRYLALYALGGSHMRAWVADVDEVMQSEARRLGVDRVRFAGRPAWVRVLPDLAIVGRVGPHSIYERAAA
jgi:hypothetical protein